MGFTIRDNMVRVDFFKQSGKWYTTEEMEWIGYDGDIFDEYRNSLKVAFKDRFSEMNAVCLEPYNKNSHPLMINMRD